MERSKMKQDYYSKFVENISMVKEKIDTNNFKRTFKETQIEESKGR